MKGDAEYLRGLYEVPARAALDCFADGDNVLVI